MVGMGGPMVIHRVARRLCLITALLTITSLIFGCAPLSAQSTSNVATVPATAAARSGAFDTEGIRGQQLPRDVKKAQVHKIVDGDTIEVVYPPDDWWYKIRLIGIDAPESVKPDTPVECFGKEASRRLAEITPVGATVYLERDVSDKDQYGRLLRHIWVVDDATGQAFLVSELLVRGGYVDARHYPPDDRYDGRLAKAELAAKHEHAGLWGACSHR